ncbi:MAG TPA: RNA ligase [Tepidisphaeraceae bacterium]|nr:RNA ligase [Tepidisphaeraceae bacterium]
MALDPALLSQLLGTHPARRMPFDELRAGLLRGAAEKRINVSRDGNLELFGYTALCQFEQQWDLFALIARGLVLDPAEKHVVATPFPKFFNFNEGGFVLPDEPFEASEKIDGSLGILFHHNGSWRISTRGQLNSLQGQWATGHLNACVNTAALTPGVTYLVEIIYYENRVVISYDFEGLVLLSAYDETGRELSRSDLESTAASAGLRIAATIRSNSFAELLEKTRALTRHQEGYVLRFQSGLRVKLKGEAYCRVHKLVCHCTPLALWESMMNCEDLDAMRQELPEEMRRDFDSIRKLLTARMESLVSEIRAAHEQHARYNDRELGLIIQNAGSGLSEVQKRLIFACRKENFLNLIDRKGEWRQKLFKFLRPERNRLEGYVPSDAMTRFEAENG